MRFAPALRATETSVHRNTPARFARSAPRLFQPSSLYANSFSTQPRFGFGHGFDQFLDHLIRIDFFGLRLEIEKDAMAQHGLGHGANVVARHVIAPVQDGARLAGQHQELRRAKRSAPRHPAVDEVGSVGARAARADQVDGVAGDRIGRRNLSHQTLKFDDLFGGHQALQVQVLWRSRHLDHGDLVLLGQVPDADVEHEAVELGFGQRIGALHLDRVLRRQYVEWFGQLIGVALYGDVAFLHRLEQRGLRLRRRAVDFVRQDDIREDRAANELQRAMSRRAVFFDDLGPRDVRGHQVGRELNSFEGKVEHAGERPNQQSLRQSGNARNDRVPADEERDQHLFDHLVLTDDHFTNLAQNPPARVGQSVQQFLVPYHACVYNHSVSLVIVGRTVSSPLFSPSSHLRSQGQTNSSPYTFSASART